MGRTSKPQAPMCCGKPAEWIINGFTCKYWYCRECKNEVLEKEFTPIPTEAPKYNFWNNPFTKKEDDSSRFEFTNGVHTIKAKDYDPEKDAYIGEDGKDYPIDFLVKNGYKMKLGYNTTGIIRWW